jgi:hypothetical protein
MFAKERRSQTRAIQVLLSLRGLEKKHERGRNITGDLGRNSLVFSDIGKVKTRYATGRFLYAGIQKPAPGTLKERRSRQ